jgi:NDP-sugar pyrophosphorylase family protein
MTSISVSKLRTLPYHDRVRFIFLQDHWFEETEILLKDFPKWDHEELEKKIASKINKEPENVCDLLRYKCINFERIFSFILQYIKLSNYCDVKTQMIIYRVSRIETINSLNQFIKFLSDKENILDVYAYMINSLDHLIHQNKEKFIDFNTIIDVCLKHLKKWQAQHILERLIKLLKNKELVQKIKDNLMIYDIMT